MLHPGRACCSRTCCRLFEHVAAWFKHAVAGIVDLAASYYRQFYVQLRLILTEHARKLVSPWLSMFWAHAKIILAHYQPTCAFLSFCSFCTIFFPFHPFLCPFFSPCLTSYVPLYHVFGPGSNVLCPLSHVSVPCLLSSIPCVPFFVPCPLSFVPCPTSLVLV